MNERQAAIDLEAIEHKTLDSISAADFVTALAGAGTIGAQALRTWPEKKKYELFVEPENAGKVTVGGLLKGVREKKKVELEKDLRTEVYNKLPGAEVELLNPQDLVTNPAFREAVTAVARDVVAQLGRP
jgi:hypothetical protein